MDGVESSSEGLALEGSRNAQMGSSFDSGFQLNSQYGAMSALEIMRETVRVLRYNCAAFMVIAACLICPVSAVQLSNLLVYHSAVRRLTIKMLLAARASGLPLSLIVKQSCHRFSETAVSTALCFPLYVTLSLLSKVAVAYSVDCSLSQKLFDASKLYAIVRKLWRRVFITYIWACVAIVGVLTLFIVLLVSVCNVFLIFGFTPDLVVYPGMFVGLVFSIVFANTIIICNIAVVISVLEDASGPRALLRSSGLIRGQIQVGLLLYLGSTIGMAFVKGLFEHRVKTVSYGDGSSRIWEGPLLVIMYSFVVLIDSMITVVFYFSCRSFGMEGAIEEAQPVLEIAIASPIASPIATSGSSENVGG